MTDAIFATLLMAPIAATIVAAIVFNSDWYEHRRRLREIRYASEIRRAKRLAEIEDEL